MSRIEKRYLAFIADGQLGKRLYGLEDTFQDWLNAFRSAGQQIEARAEEVAAVFLLGDTFDAEALYPTEIYAAQTVVSRLRAAGLPVYGILGNHDKGQSDARQVTSWLDVCGITPMVPTQPIYLPEAPGIPSAWVLGLNHQGKELLAKTLEEMKPPTKPAKYCYLCLHQSLEELAPHKGAGELACKQVPSWVTRVFMGDFHNASSCIDKLGRTFLYPGSIETVSFNQDKEPGFIFFDRKTDLISHHSTKQRDYLKYNFKTTIPDLTAIQEELTASTLAHSGRKPVVQLTYPPTQAEATDAAYDALKPYCLRVLTNPLVEEVAIATTKPIDPNEAILPLAASLLPDSPVGELGRLLLRTPTADVLRDWQKTHFPKTQRKPK